jgi:CRP/FNR family transcriptional regulator, nitrogen fixation regulation protein
MQAPATSRTARGVEINNRDVVREEHWRGPPVAGSVLDFVQNRMIYSEGDEANSFFKVVLGVVRTCRFLSDGQRQIDAFYAAGDVFGLEAGAEHSFSAEAVTGSSIISYRRRDLAALTANNEGFSQQLFTYAMQRLARAQEHAVLLGRRSAVKKVAAFLIDWAAYSPESTIIALEMTRQDIADYLGLTVETVSRTFSHLERNALIERPSLRQIKLKDRKRLRDLSS